MKSRVEPAMMSLPDLAGRVGWPEALVRDWWRKGMLPPPEVGEAERGNDEREQVDRGPEPVDHEPEPRWRHSEIERWLDEGRS